MLLNSNLNYDYSIFLDMRNLQEQVRKAFCYQKLFWLFTVWINCYSDLKNFTNSRSSAVNFKSFSRTLEQFFLTVGQNNFNNKIPLLLCKSVSVFHAWRHFLHNCTVGYAFSWRVLPFFTSHDSWWTIYDIFCP